MERDRIKFLWRLPNSYFGMYRSTKALCVKIEVHWMWLGRHARWARCKVWILIFGATRAFAALFLFFSYSQFLSNNWLKIRYTYIIDLPQLCSQRWSVKYTLTVLQTNIWFLETLLMPQESHCYPSTVPDTFWLSSITNIIRWSYRILGATVMGEWSLLG